MRARTAWSLTAALLVSGCGDPVSLCYPVDALFYLPAVDVENLNRVCGHPRRPVPAVVAEPGNVWPPAPIHVPTELDLQQQSLGHEVAAAPRHARGFGLCRRSPPQPGAAASVPRGVALGLCYRPVAGGRAGAG